MTLLRVVSEMSVTLAPGAGPVWWPSQALTPWFVPFRGLNALNLHHAPASAAPPQLGTNGKPDLKEGFPFPAASVKTYCHDIIKGSGRNGSNPHASPGGFPVPGCFGEDLVP